MAFSDNQFARARPFLFHLTSRTNVDEIGKLRTLHSAATTMQESGDVTYLRRKRKESVDFPTGTATVSVRDQQPLHAGNIRLESGWRFEDLVQSLNERIFFWPGTHKGPISYGRRHLERYANEAPVILRVSTADLYAANHDVFPLYCRYNSGSPRCSKGRGSPRGPNTFVRSADADYTPARVVEVTFLQQVTLPPLLEVGDSLFGPWRKL
jgi:hypothetical protein